MSARRFLFFAYSRFVDTIDGLHKTAANMLRILAEMVDHRTARTHHRFPVSQARLMRRLRCSESTVNRVLAVLEDLCLIRRYRKDKHQDARGRIRQGCTDYELLGIPDDCWRVLEDVAFTSIAREPEPKPPRERFTSPAAMVLSVRGKQSTRDAETPLVRERAPRPFDPNGCTADLVSPEELAAELVHEGCVAAETCCEERRFVAVASLYELSRRAVEVAGEATDLGLSSGRARAAVRQWVARCLSNAEQMVESPAHALNILRRFLASAVTWEERAAVRTG